MFGKCWLEWLESAFDIRSTVVPGIALRNETMNYCLSGYLCVDFISVFPQQTQTLHDVGQSYSAFTSMKDVFFQNNKLDGRVHELLVGIV